MEAILCCEVLHGLADISIFIPSGSESINDYYIESTNPANGEMYTVQHYAIKFVNDLQQVGGFLWVLQVSPLIKLAATI